MNKRDVQQDLRFPSLIVFTGFRATGKTAVGRCLSELIGYRFLDTDAEVAARMGCSIAESVSRHGWPYFREHERALLDELPSWRKTVISTGGGAVLHQSEWQKLHDRAFVVWLRTDVATTLARLRQDKKTAGQRPPLGSPGVNQDMATEVSALLTEREPLYQAGSDMVIDTEGSTQKVLAECVYNRLAPDYRCLKSILADGRKEEKV